MHKHQKFHRYFYEWMQLYKQGAVAEITYKKYLDAYKSLKEIAPDITLDSLSRLTYQSIINEYAKTHERQTVSDFHHHLRSSLLDAIEENLIRTDPSRKVVIKGNVTRHHKQKFLNKNQLERLLSQLDLSANNPYDYLILLITKTGLRFAEAAGLTKADIDFQHQYVNVNKTLNYKSPNISFAPTKNVSSIRKVRIDWLTCSQLQAFAAHLADDELLFARSKRIFNATVNDYLEKLCIKADIPVISLHGLRHTHASLLLYAGLSIASVAKRLGHSNMTTTQKTYLHVIAELENQDTDKLMYFLSSL